MYLGLGNELSLNMWQAIIYATNNIHSVGPSGIIFMKFVIRNAAMCIDTHHYKSHLADIFPIKYDIVAHHYVNCLSPGRFEQNFRYEFAG